MALSKERKVLLGLLGSAGLILVVDQVMLSAPRGAQAQDSVPTPTETPQASLASDAQSDKVAGAPENLEAVRPWNEKLAAAAGDAALASDPFVAPRAGQAEVPGIISPSAFRSAHRLSAVLTGGEVGVAMVNQQAVRVGETIAGYRLLRVDDRWAEFAAGDEIVRLELPSQPRGGG